MNRYLMERILLSLTKKNQYVIFKATLQISYIVNLFSVTTEKTFSWVFNRKKMPISINYLTVNDLFPGEENGKKATMIMKIRLQVY